MVVADTVLRAKDLGIAAKNVSAFIGRLSTSILALASQLSSSLGNADSFQRTAIR